MQKVIPRERERDGARERASERRAGGRAGGRRGEGGREGGRSPELVLEVAEAGGQVVVELLELPHQHVLALRRVLELLGPATRRGDGRNVLTFLNG